jgi:hypothetical protein
MGMTEKEFQAISKMIDVLESVATEVSILNLHVAEQVMALERKGAKEALKLWRQAVSEKVNKNDRR